MKHEGVKGDDEAIRPQADLLWSKIKTHSANEGDVRKALLRAYEQGYEFRDMSGEDVYKQGQERGEMNAVGRLKEQVLEMAAAKFRQGKDAEANLLRDVANKLALPQHV